MKQLDEDALVCDLAETYGIYDYKQLPLLKVAVFAYWISEYHSLLSPSSNGWAGLRR